MYTIIALVCMCDVFCMNMRRLSCVNVVCCMYTQSYEIVCTNSYRVHGNLSS